LNLERATRLELVSLAWKARAQPLYHTREFFSVLSFDSFRDVFSMFIRFGLTF
jgi:hypothetical protein